MKKIASLFAFWLISTCTLLAQWSQITNIPVPAYISGMDIDGANLYAGAETGLFKSTNNGATWSLLNSEIRNGYLVEASGNNLYTFDGFSGNFYYSSDGGATFQARSDLGYLGDILAQGNTVFVTNESGLLVSNDAGETFTNLNIAPANSFNSGTVEQTPVGKIYTGVSFGSEILNLVLRSVDGITWTDISGSGGSNPLPTFQNGGLGEWYWSAYINGALLVGGWSYDGQGALFKTTDLGANWYPVDNSLFAWTGQITGFGSGKVFVYGDTYEQHYSTDGTTWPVSNAPGQVLAADGTKFIAYNYNGSPFLSVNNGVTWPQILTPQGNDIVRDFLSLNANTYFAVTTHNGIYKGAGSNPANLSWTKVLGEGVNSGGDYGWDLFRKGSILLAGIDFVAGGNKGIYRSVNQGNTWTKTHNGRASASSTTAAPSTRAWTTRAFSNPTTPVRPGRRPTPASRPTPTSAAPQPS